MGKIPNIIEALESPALFGPIVGPLETWAHWLTALKALYGLPFNEQDAETFKACTGRDAPAAGGYQEFYAICGRRGGKSRLVSLIASYEALFGNWTERLSPGERGWIFVIATDKRQAGVCLGYIKSALSLFPDLIEREYADEIHLTNRISIATKTCSFRASRGYTTCLVIADELAYWRDDEASANPAESVINSLLPGLLPLARLCGISTPYGRLGFLWQMHKSYFGKESDILVWQASTKYMNPTFSDSTIKRLIARDPSVFRAEFQGEFREDIENFLSLELLTAAATREQSLPDPRQKYTCFIDPSGGRADSMTLAIAHMEGEKIICDRCEEIRAPFDPVEVVQGFATLMKSFGITRCTSDRYGGVWVESAFQKHGIRIEMSDLSASDIYLEFQPLLSSARCEIINSERLLAQFQGLERRTASGGRDRVEHQPGGHDDLCNAVAGACVFASRNRIVTLADMEKYLPIKGCHQAPCFAGQSERAAMEAEMDSFMVQSGGNRIIR